MSAWIFALNTDGLTPALSFTPCRGSPADRRIDEFDVGAVIELQRGTPENPLALEPTEMLFPYSTNFIGSPARNLLTGQT